MSTVRKRNAGRTADNDDEAAGYNLIGNGTSGSESKPPNRSDRVGKTALIWPWHATPGQHVRPIILEAMGILKNEGWVVGRITDPDLPFDLIGILDRAAVFVKAVRAKCTITNAKETAKVYWKEIKKMQPFWNSDGDNLQFWVFSRLAGVLRYRVYRGGIWNEATRIRQVVPDPLLVPLPQSLRTAA
jgi:hypothetical protein